MTFFDRHYRTLVVGAVLATFTGMFALTVWWLPSGMPEPPIEVIRARQVPTKIPVPVLIRESRP